MSHSMPLDEALSFESGQLLPGPALQEDPTKPIGSNLHWLSSYGNLIVRVVQSHQFEIWLDENIVNTELTSAGIIRVTLFENLLAVALNDGSVNCYNCLNDSLDLRWRLEEVHSFTGELENSQSSSRDNGSIAAGPLTSLEFSSSLHYLVLVDAHHGSLTILNAAEASPKPLSTTNITGASCATWTSSNQLVVGGIDGSLNLYELDNNHALVSSQQTNLQAPEQASDFTCTHLQYHDSTLVVGYCCSTVGQYDDDEDEDDSAEHEVELYLTNLDSSGNMDPWVGLEEVVPFFSVPKNGRHVFYTTFLYPNLLAVGANIGSDIMLIDTSEKQILELSEGANATTPTTEDDEYTFPIGLTTCQNDLYVLSTDGSKKQFILHHAEDEAYFNGYPQPKQPVEILPIVAAPPPSCTIDASAVDEMTNNAVLTPGSNISTVDSSAYSETPESRSAASSVTPFSAGTPFGALSSPRFNTPSSPTIFGASSSTPAFGAGTTTPSFGSTTPFGAGTTKPSFGSTTLFGAGTTKPSFGAPASGGITFGSPAAGDSNPFTFGVPSQLGVNNPSNSPTKPPEKPVAGSFGSGTSVPTFGSTGKSTFGSNFSRPQFGQLASDGEKVDFGSAAKSSASDNPFGAFSSSKSTSAVGGPSSAMVQPLFGTPAKKTEEAATSKQPATKSSSASGYPPMSAKAPSKTLGGTDSSSSQNTPNATKDRLIAIYQKHKPEKLQDVDKLLKKYKGREDEMFAKIRDVYKLDENDQKLNPHKVRLMEIYAKKVNKPEKIKDIDKLLKKYQGKEDAMFQRIRDVYKLDDDFNPIKETKKVEAKEVIETKEEKENKPGAKTAASAFGSIDIDKAGNLPTNKFEDLLDEVGEGFHGDEFDVQLKKVDPTGSKQISRSAFISWYCALLEEADNNDDKEIDEEEQEERDDERNRAREVFLKFSQDGGKTVHIDKYPSFMKGLGTTYDGDGVHGKAAAKMKQADGSISWDAFSEWYVEYIFGDDEEDEDTDTEQEQDDEAVINKIEEGWGNMFAKPKDSWKCEVCFIQNKNDTVICVSCESVRPGFEEEAKKEKAAKAASSGASTGAGGFSFGTTSSSSTEINTNKFGFGQSATTDSGSAFESSGGGFSFGAKSTGSSSAFGFGTTKPDDKAPASSGFGFGNTGVGGGFSFGSGPAPPKKDTNESGVSSSDGAKATAVVKDDKKDSAAKPATSEDVHRIRLVNFYKTNKPEKLKDVDKLLKKFKGKEDDMFKRVEEVYKIKVPPASASSASSTSASSYPPMSSKSPSANPFGKKEPSSSSSSASGYPPMAAKAPSNAFGTTATKASSGTAAPKSTATSGYPPISSQAPSDPFAGTTAPSSSSSKTTAASGYPPISSQAPSNPFGGTTAPSSSSSKTTVASGYPPMSSQAPSKSFGGTASSTSSTSKTTAAASGYPPIASQAPSNSFGGTASSTSSTVKNTAASGYPPMSSQAPSKSFGVTASSAKAPPVASAWGTPSSTTTAEPTTAFGAVGFQSLGKAPSNPFGTPKQPADKSAAFGSFSKPDIPKSSSSQPTTIVQKTLTVNHSQGNQSTSRLAIKASHADTPSNEMKDSPIKFDNNPPRYVSELEKQFVKEMGKFQESISSLSQPSNSSLESIEEELKRLISSREKMWNYVEDFSSEISNKSDRVLFLISRKPDLERQAEEARRCVELHIRSLNQKDNMVSDLSLDAGSERMRRKLAATAIMIPRYLDIIKFRCGETDGKKGVLGILKCVSDQSEILDQHTCRCSNKIEDLSRRIPRSNDAFTSKSSGNLRRRNRIAPDSAVEERMKAFTESQAASMSKKTGTSRWREVEAALGTKSRGQPKQTKIALSQPILAIQNENEKNRASRSYHGCQLISPTPGKSQQSESRSSGTSVTANLFSPVADSLAPRAGWESGFTSDQMKAKKLSFNLPKHLNEIASSDAAREALSQYGTTPEKLAKVTEAKKRGEAASKAKLVPSASTKQPPSDRAPTPLSSSSTAVFPPMPTSAPTPFSQKASTDSTTKTNQPVSKTSSTAFTDKQSKPSNVLKTPPKQEEKAKSTAFGDMKGFGDSLFSTEGEKRAPSTAPREKPPIAPIAAKVPDYVAIMTKFYQKHNPSKMNDIPKTLEKYKGKEKELFSKLAKKYKDTNPLESTTGPFVPEPAFGQGVKAPFGSGLSASTGGSFASATASSTPFGSGVGSDPSPFGSAPAPATSSSSKATGSFGQPSPAPSATPFGAATGSSPFGQPSTQSKTAPFGGSGTNAMPFGQSSNASPFGNSTQSSSAPAPSSFGTSTQPTNAPAPTPFGTSAQPSNAPAPSPFGASTSTPNAAAPVSFGAPSSGATPFGAASPSPFGSAASAPPKTFAGKTPKDMLLTFYQQYNASKLNTVDQVLQKYQGNEEKLFRNLAKKYNLDPSVFGLSSSTPAFGGGGGGFGQPSPLGGGGGFGASSPGPAPAFAATSTFGNTSALPAASPPASFGATSSGFGGGGTASGGFGSLAQQGGGSFGSSNAGSFGGPTPFGGTSAAPNAGFGGSPSPFGGPRR